MQISTHSALDRVSTSIHAFRPIEALTILLGGDILVKCHRNLIQQVRVQRGQVPGELIAHHRDVELVVDARAERVPELQHLCMRATRGAWA